VGMEEKLVKGRNPEITDHMLVKSKERADSTRKQLSVE